MATTPLLTKEYARLLKSAQKYDCVDAVKDALDENLVELAKEILKLCRDNRSKARKNARRLEREAIIERDFSHCCQACGSTHLVDFTRVLTYNKRGSRVKPISEYLTRADNNRWREEAAQCVRFCSRCDYQFINEWSRYHGRSWPSVNNFMEAVRSQVSNQTQQQVRGCSIVGRYSHKGGSKMPHCTGIKIVPAITFSGNSAVVSVTVTQIR